MDNYLEHQNVDKFIIKVFEYCAENNVSHKIFRNKKLQPGSDTSDMIFCEGFTLYMENEEPINFFVIMKTGTEEQYATELYKIKNEAVFKAVYSSYVIGNALALNQQINALNEPAEAPTINKL